MDLKLQCENCPLVEFILRADAGGDSVSPDSLLVTVSHAAGSFRLRRSRLAGQHANFIILYIFVTQCEAQMS